MKAAEEFGEGEDDCLAAHGAAVAIETAGGGLRRLAVAGPAEADGADRLLRAAAGRAGATGRRAWPAMILFTPAAAMVSPAVRPAEISAPSSRCWAASHSLIMWTTALLLAQFLGKPRA